VKKMNEKKERKHPCLTDEGMEGGNTCGMLHGQVSGPTTW